MSTINSISIASNLITNNQTSTAQQTDSVSNSPTVAAGATDNASNQDKVEISTRAQKIQKLNEEFFSGGIDSFSVTQDFIQRLADYGLITADEAIKLGENAETSESGDGSTVGELSSFIGSFSESLQKTDPNDTLIDVLQQAKTVLDNFNSPTQTSQNVNIAQVSSQLQKYIDTSGEKLSATDNQSLNQLVSALDVASILTPGKNTTSQINSYLAIKNM